jgi:hypothetical protein
MTRKRYLKLYYQKHKRVCDARTRLTRTKRKAAGLTMRGTERKNAF